MLNQDASVHHHRRSGRGGTLRGVFIQASQLEPHRGRARGQRIFHDPRQLVAAPKYVDHVDAARHVLQPAIRLLPEDCLFAGVHGDHLVPALEEITADPIGVAMRLGGEPDDGDPAGSLQQPVDRRIVGVLECHEGRTVNRLPSFVSICTTLRRSCRPCA